MGSTLLSSTLHFWSLEHNCKHRHTHTHTCTPPQWLTDTMTDTHIHTSACTHTHEICFCFESFFSLACDIGSNTGGDVSRHAHLVNQTGVHRYVSPEPACWCRYIIYYIYTSSQCLVQMSVTFSVVRIIIPSFWLQSIAISVVASFHSQSHLWYVQ